MHGEHKTTRPLRQLMREAWADRAKSAAKNDKPRRGAAMAVALLGAAAIPSAAATGVVGVSEAADAHGTAEHQNRSGQAEASNAGLSPQLIDDAGDPRKLAMAAGPVAELPRGPLGVPGTALRAYHRAASVLSETDPRCHLPWSLVAAIGRIESRHADGGQLNAAGDAVVRILGPALNGARGTAKVADTDQGRLDGDRRGDRAVGPMQFIPSTWQRFGADGNGDGKADPNNIHDASLATGRELCSGGGDLANPSARAAAVFGYNHSNAYVRNVLIWSAAYAAGVEPTTIAPSVAGLPPLPPPNLGPPAPAAPPPHAAPAHPPKHQAPKPHPSKPAQQHPSTHPSAPSTPPPHPSAPPASASSSAPSSSPAPSNPASSAAAQSPTSTSPTSTTPPQCPPPEQTTPTAQLGQPGDPTDPSANQLPPGCPLPTDTPQAGAKAGDPTAQQSPSPAARSASSAPWERAAAMRQSSAAQPTTAG